MVLYADVKRAQWTTSSYTHQSQAKAALAIRQALSQSAWVQVEAGVVYCNALHHTAQTKLMAILAGAKRRDGDIMNPLITKFYIQFYSWRVPEESIRIQQGGNWLSFLRLWDKRINGCTWAYYPPYVISLTAEHWEDLPLLTHELWHCHQREQYGPSFWLQYLSKGCGAQNIYEVEARRIEQEFKAYVDSQR